MAAARSGVGLGARARCRARTHCTPAPGWRLKKEANGRGDAATVPVPTRGPPVACVRDVGEGRRPNAVDVVSSPTRAGGGTCLRRLPGAARPAPRATPRSPAGTPGRRGGCLRSGPAIGWRELTMGARRHGSGTSARQKQPSSSTNDSPNECYAGFHRKRGYVHQPIAEFRIGPSMQITEM